MGYLRDAKAVANSIMKTLIIFALVALLGAVMLVKSGGRISASEARDYLEKGALLVDVRSRAEYASDHLANAANFPLDEIESSLPIREPNKNRVLLLHCQSGTRSAVATQKLRRIGYTNVFNLGSLERARKIVEMPDNP